MANKNTVLLMLCDKEPLEAIRTSLESMIAQNEFADIDILDNCSEADVREYLQDRMDCIGGYHRTQLTLDYATAYLQFTRFGEKINYPYFIIVQPGDILPQGYVERCETIIQNYPYAELLLFNKSPELKEYHGKMIEENREPIYNALIKDHSATITQAFIRTDSSYWRYYYPPAVQNMPWVMLFSLSQSRLVIWNQDSIVHSPPLPKNPFYYLLCRYERLAALIVPANKELFMGIFSSYAGQALKALAFYAVEMAQKLVEVGRIHDAENCLLFAPVAWYGIAQEEVYAKLGVQLGMTEFFND